MNARMPHHSTAGRAGRAGLAGLFGAGLLVSACSSSPHRSSTGSTTTSSSAPSPTVGPGGTTVASSSTSSAPASTAPTTSARPSGPGRCATSSLRGALTGANGTAGSTYYTLVLTNTGSATCLLQGFAGVSFVTGPNHQQVGAAAARAGAAGPTITLAPGRGAGATLQITDASNFGTPCGITPTNGLRVYPPGQLASLVIPHADHACSNTTDLTLHIGSFQP